MHHIPNNKKGSPIWLPLLLYNTHEGKLLWRSFNEFQGDFFLTLYSFYQVDTSAVLMPYLQAASFLELG
jgi:hypothetical protein